jgi:hypothetical protein
VGCFGVRTEGEEKEPRRDSVSSAVLSRGGRGRGGGSGGGRRMEGGNEKERGGPGVSWDNAGGAV